MAFENIRVTQGSWKALVDRFRVSIRREHRNHDDVSDMKVDKVNHAFQLFPRPSKAFRLPLE